MTDGLEKKNRIVAVGTSLGGLEALRTVLSSLPENLAAPMLIVMHIGAFRSVLPQLLSPVCTLPVTHAIDGTVLEPSKIYIAPPDRHLVVQDGRVRLTTASKENFTRPAIDPLFRSVAVEYGPRAIAVVLTGDLDDGAAGAAAVDACGGRIIVEAPNESVAASMPAAALRAVPSATVVPLDGVGQAIVDALRQPIKGVSMSPQKQRIEAEARMTLTGFSSPEELDRLGTRSTLTCPDCGGVVWEISDAPPLRYRCHTGHAFSEASLDAAQKADAEDALWTSVRHVEERAMLAARRARMAETLGDDARAKSERDLSQRLLRLGGALRDFVLDSAGNDDDPSSGPSDNESPISAS
ncbi:MULTISPECIES: chemotaxis protein CheB [unclassified Caballeronia]|uniref:chemotaxis protein CheB n=1 Tax=unclassified Caballeronia TaxID=2646786 RepID=UPI00285F8055|nr:MULTISPECIES: chemotaxis protein CheB [unclassified Caballeronia]MDR5763086.1 chemotaxis protein CheB [Caballeronia sp. LZ035]MDR5883920.1 chemotaxis protein CheB [Caballeronia sp. LZ032]